MLPTAPLTYSNVGSSDDDIARDEAGGRGTDKNGHPASTAAWRVSSWPCTAVPREDLPTEDVGGGM